MTDRQPPTAPGCLAYGLFALALCWVIAIGALMPPIAWFTHDIMSQTGGTWPWYLDALLSLIQALLIGVPLALLAALTPYLALRAAYRTWALAAGVAALLGLLRAIPPFFEQIVLLAYALIGLLVWGLLGRLGRRASVSDRRPKTEDGNDDRLPSTIFGSQGDSSLAVALGLVPLLIFPWLLWGAAGSLFDTLLALAAGLGIGLLVSTLVGRRLLPALRQPGASPGATVGFGGLVCGTLLLILCGGLGLGAAQVLLLSALPALGLLLFVLAYRAASPGMAITSLVGLCAAAPLALFDAEEINIVLGADIPVLAQRAASQAFLLALVASLCAWLWLALRPAAAPTPLRQRLPLVLAGGSLAAATLVYALFGHPGFYGDRLFVILRSQADLRPAGQLATPGERRSFVYRTLTAHANQTQAGLRSTLRDLGIGYQPYYLVNAIEVDGGPLLAAYLATRPEVDRVLHSPRLRPLPAPPPPEPDTASAPEMPDWNLTLIGADRVWRELEVTGAGVLIGQSDSGVDGQHPELRDSYRGRDGNNAYNWLDPWYGAPAPRDYGSHGTHTLGTVLGNRVGVAPDAEWIACSNLARNLANPALYLDCMQFMLAPYAPGTDPLAAGDPLRGAQVLNNSWGCPPEEGCDPTSLQAAVAALRSAGVFVVASGGNEGPGCATLGVPLALYDDVLTVGAVDTLGDLASFSSRGPVESDGSGRSKPDILAPGVGVLSSMPAGSYGYADGTSMAGPHVAGVVALMWSANPRLVGDVAQTERLLLETAQPYAGTPVIACGDPANATGRGVVDAYTAVQAALALGR